LGCGLVVETEYHSAKEPGSTPVGIKP